MDRFALIWAAGRFGVRLSLPARGGWRDARWARRDGRGERAENGPHPAAAGSSPQGGGM